MDAMDYIIPFALVLGFSLATSITATRKFSMNIFLASVAVGIAVLVWIPIIPRYSIALSVLIVIGILLSDKDQTDTVMETNE